MDKLTDQLVAEIKKQAPDLDRLQFGEVILKVQDGKVVRGEIVKAWKADSKVKN